MASWGRGHRGGGQGNNQPPRAFDQQAFLEVISIATAIIAQASVVVATFARTSATEGQGGMSDLQGFQVHHPLPYMREGDSMVRTALAIKREIEDTWSIRDTGASDKRKEGQPSSSSGKK